MQSLLQTWKETGELVNQNTLFMVDNGIKKELIRFLMDGIVSQTDYVKLVKTNDIISFDGNNLEQNSIFYSQTEYDNILFSLINYYPQKIEVEHYKEFDVHFIQNLHELFGSKVHFID